MKTLNHSLLVAVTLATVGFAISRAAGATDEALLAKAKISKTDAEKTALATVPAGTIKSAELEEEHGKLIWSFDIARPSTKNITEVQVNAKTGKVVSKVTETPEDQAKEAEADAAAKK
jgi:uncharacterized membrane protein YkoI